MFTGIVQAVGTVVRIEAAGADRRLSIDAGDLGLVDSGIGQSICVNGVCVTVVACIGQVFDADLSTETLSCTTLGGLAIGSPVNLEKAMPVDGRLAGHFVSGHVDGTGRVVSLEPSGHSVSFEIEAPEPLARYLCRKGSVCVDGTSLTINEVRDRRFCVNIIPHTLQETIFPTYRVGSEVNIEVDIIARYLERLLEFSR